MIFLIYLFSLLMLVAGVTLLVKPSFIPGIITRYSGSTALYATAILVRLALGALLLYLASLSRYPVAISIIGWIAILAAAVFAAIGKRRFEKMLLWILDRVHPWSRLGGLAALIFAAFLLYSFA